MSPLEFLRTVQPDRAVLTGEAFSQDPVGVVPGDVVGVVMMELGGPLRPDEVVPFLESRLLDPVEVEMRVPRLFRPQAARAYARRLGRALQRSFEMIGGASPMRRHVSEQAAAVQRRLDERFAAATGATFRTYVAMRHGDPSMATARQRMADDGVTKVVLLPLQPQFSVSTAGSALAYWRAHGPVSAPSSLVAEYATHPKLVAALNERIDEGLQRFSREMRGQVQILFAAHSASRRHLTRLDDPYCCHVHATVRAVLAAREESRASAVAFLDPLGSGGTIGPRLGDAVADLADDGATALLVVPVSFLSDRVDTAYDLDVTARAVAASEGIQRFEVTNGLNVHPLLIDALAECVGAQIQTEAVGGDGLGLALRDAQVTTSDDDGPGDERAPCPVCDRAIPIRTWPADESPASEPTSEPTSELPQSRRPAA